VGDLTRCKHFFGTHNKSILVTKTGLFDIPGDSLFVSAQGVKEALELIYRRINCKQWWNNEIYNLASSWLKFSGNRLLDPSRFACGFTTCRRVYCVSALCTSNRSVNARWHDTTLFICPCGSSNLWIKFRG
jgi:hypothetical protein